MNATLSQPNPRPKAITQKSQRRGQLIVLDRSGDIKLIWNAERQDEIDAAESMFDEMRCKGYLAYKVDDEGDQGEVIREFDPETERIIMSPPMQGG